MTGRSWWCHRDPRGIGGRPVPWFFCQAPVVSQTATLVRQPIRSLRSSTTNMIRPKPPKRASTQSCRRIARTNIERVGNGCCLVIATRCLQYLERGFCAFHFSLLNSECWKVLSWIPPQAWQRRTSQIWCDFWKRNMVRHEWCFGTDMQNGIYLPPNCIQLSSISIDFCVHLQHVCHQYITQGADLNGWQYFPKPQIPRCMSMSQLCCTQKIHPFHSHDPSCRVQRQRQDQRRRSQKKPRVGGLNAMTFHWCCWSVFGFYVVFIRFYVSFQFTDSMLDYKFLWSQVLLEVRICRRIICTFILHSYGILSWLSKLQMSHVTRLFDIDKKDHGLYSTCACALCHC